jgi:hypothetical protein
MSKKMERIVVERQILQIYIAIALAVFVLALAAFILLFVGLDTYFAVSLFFLIPMAIMLLVGAYHMTRPKNMEIMIIDDRGLTIKGNIMLGPYAKNGRTIWARNDTQKS